MRYPRLYIAAVFVALAGLVGAMIAARMPGGQSWLLAIPSGALIGIALGMAYASGRTQR